MLKRTAFCIGAAVLALGACTGTVSSRGDGGGGDAGDNAHTDNSVGGDPSYNPERGPVPSIGVPIAVVDDVETALPPLPPLVGVAGTVRDDTVQVGFEPHDDAVDYRIYPLPPDDNIVVDGDMITIPNATYRCAGFMQQGATIPDDGGPTPPGASHAYTYAQSQVEGYQRSLAEATLGHVYVTPGDGRVPVYALGDPNPEQGNPDYSYASGWSESRVKRYTASATERETLRSQGWRDDGIKFYVPAAASGDTQPVYASGPLYFTSAGERSARNNAPEAGFVVFKTAQAGTRPLKRVHYRTVTIGNGGPHDELMVGEARFEAAYRKNNHPLPHVLFSGVKEPTILVIEALESGCPYQGMMAARHIDALTTTADVCSTCPPYAGTPGNGGFGQGKHEAYVTLDEMRAASETSEVFVNGQHDVTTRPRPIARSFIQVEPVPPPQMDFYDSFHVGTTLSFPPFQPVSPENYSREGSSWFTENDTYRFGGYALEYDGNGQPLMAVGSFLGQLWVTFGDAAADTNGKFRLEPKAPATLAANTFLHATMSIDSTTTRRRYPQIMVSDQPRPIQETMHNGHTVVVEPIISWPARLVIQFCDLDYWDVNHQCSFYELFHSDDNATESERPYPPVIHAPDRMATDRSNQYDVYVSTERVYLFFDGQPYGCADLPSGRMQAGPAQVAFGDVLYHSGADIIGGILHDMYKFHARHLYFDTRRHYDEVGFSSGVNPPEWDETLIPCQDASRLKPFNG